MRRPPRRRGHRSSGALQTLQAQRYLLGLSPIALLVGFKGLQLLTPLATEEALDKPGAAPMPTQGISTARAAPAADFHRLPSRLGRDPAHCSHRAPGVWPGEGRSPAGAALRQPGAPLPGQPTGLYEPAAAGNRLRAGNGAEPPEGWAVAGGEERWPVQRGSPSEPCPWAFGPNRVPRSSSAGDPLLDSRPLASSSSVKPKAWP